MQIMSLWEWIFSSDCNTYFVNMLEDWISHREMLPLYGKTPAVTELTSVSGGMSLLGIRGTLRYGFPLLKAISRLGRTGVFAMLSYINRKNEPWIGWDVPKVVAVPKRNLILRSGSFSQGTLETCERQVSLEAASRLRHSWVFVCLFSCAPRAHDPTEVNICQGWSSHPTRLTVSRTGNHRSELSLRYCRESKFKELLKVNLPVEGLACGECVWKHVFCKTQPH